MGIISIAEMLHSNNHILKLVRVTLDHEETWSEPHTVQKANHETRSYLVDTPNGKTLQRNRRHLQRVESPVKETLNEQDTNENSDKVAEK